VEENEVIKSELQSEKLSAISSERDRILAAICAWAKDHEWAAPGWKDHPSNKALFDIAHQYKYMGKE
jgi:hypothetical protein